MAGLVRAAFVTALIGLAVAIALPALHIGSPSTAALISVWWPVVLIGGGVGGLAHRGPGGTWLFAALLAGGIILLAAHFIRVPIGRLALAAVVFALGVSVALERRDWH